MDAASRSRHSRSMGRVGVVTSEGCHPLPDWAYTYVVVGSRVAEADAAPPRLLVALAVPIRAFAAAFCAVGVVATRSVIPISPAAREEYLKWLCTLPKGTRLEYDVGESIAPAILEGCDYEAGTLSLRLRVLRNTGPQTSWLPITALDRIRSVSRALGAGIAGDPGSDPFEQFLTGWCQHLLSGTEQRQFFLGSGTQCVIVGQLTRLREEIEATPFCVRGAGGQCAHGTLQDVLAVEGFGGHHVLSRSRVITASAFSGEDPTHKRPGPIVIFDGPNSYLRWHDSWRNSSSIVILDRTDPSFDLAVEQLRRDFVQKRLNDATIRGLPLPPPGVEILAFNEGRK